MFSGFYPVTQSVTLHYPDFVFLQMNIQDKVGEDLIQYMVSGVKNCCFHYLTNRPNF